MMTERIIGLKNKGLELDISEAVIKQQCPPVTAVFTH